MGDAYLTARVLDALSDSECSVCRLLIDDRDRYLDTLLYEFVNDGAVRKRLRTDGGFCPFHSWSMKQLGNPLGHAIIYTDLLESIGQRRDDPGARECMVCQHLRERQSTYISVLTELVRSDSLRTTFETKGFLCAEHHEALQMKLGTADRRWLEGVRGQVAERVLDELRTLMKSYDYRFSNQPVNSDIWLQAIEFLKGSEATTFGVRRRRGPIRPPKGFVMRDGEKR